MIFSTLLGFYKERRRAKKAIVEFEKFVEKLRDQQTKEESAEAKGEDEEVNPPASGDDDDEDKNKTKSWKKRVTDFGKNCKTRLASVGRRVKQAAKWLWERRKIKNKRLLELFFLVTLFLAMQAIGSLFYFAIALKFPMNTQKTGTVVGVAVQTVMFAILVSRHLRAIFFVTLPSLVGSRLRTILIIMMLIWAFQFPAQNVTTNIQSAMEGVNCVSQRVKAVAEEVKDRAGHAFRDAPMEQMREFLKDQAKPFEGIRKTMRKLDDSLEKMVAWQRELIGKIKNMMNNCSSLAQLPLKACVGWLGERHVDCLERFFEAICKPIDLAKHLCYLTKVFELNCDWPARLKGSIKEGVGNFVKGAKRRVGDYARETFVYDMYNKTVKHGVVAFKTLEIVIKHEQNYTEELDFDKERIHNELRKEIEGFGRFMNMIIFVLDVLMVLLTIWPFVMSVLYVRKFKKSESADNHYIDSHFEAIDQARAVNGQLTLLPLLPKEKMKYIRTCSLRTTRKEWIFMCVAHMFLLFSVLPIGVFILVDIFVYKLIRRAFIFFHGDSTIFPVPSIYKLKVSGNGYLNQLLGNILHTFEPLTDAKERDQLWRQCFVQPRPPNYDIFQVILAMYFVCALLIKVQIYVKRTKHLIALHYFPDRARPRALHLYDQILSRRMQLWDMMVDVQKSKDIDVTDNDRKLLLKGLGVLSADKQRCLRCARTDLSLQETQNVRLCVRCHSVYCVDCFAARQRCVKKECRASLQAITAEVELYIDSSCAEDDDSDMDIGDDDDEQEEEEEEEVVDEMEAMDEKLVETGVEVKEKAEEKKKEKMVENANKEVPEEQPKPMGEEEAVEPKPNP